MPMSIIFPIFFIPVTAGLIALQIFFSTRETKWYGLILPILTLVAGVTLTIVLAIYGSSYDETPSLITLGITLGATLIDIVIYVICKENQKKKQKKENEQKPDKEQLDKMNIMDL